MLDQCRVDRHYVLLINIILRPKQNAYGLFVEIVSCTEEVVRRIRLVTSRMKMLLVLWRWPWCSDYLRQKTDTLLQSHFWEVFTYTSTIVKADLLLDLHPTDSFTQSILNTYLEDARVLPGSARIIHSGESSDFCYSRTYLRISTAMVLLLSCSVFRTATAYSDEPAVCGQQYPARLSGAVRPIAATWRIEDACTCSNIGPRERAYLLWWWRVRDACTISNVGPRKRGDEFSWRSGESVSVRLPLSEAVGAIYIERNVGLSYSIDDGRNK